MRYEALPKAAELRGGHTVHWHWQYARLVDGDPSSDGLARGLFADAVRVLVARDIVAKQDVVINLK